MPASSNCSENAQAKNPKRKLDHLADLADGYDQWDMIPRRLSRAYIDGKFPESKFRLLLCMMSHSGGFHVKRSYLEERFSPNSLSKYVSELIDEGYICVESIQNTAGRHINLYHVRPLSDWALYRQNVDPIVSEARPSVDPIVSEAIAREDDKDFNLKDFNLKNENPQSEAKTEEPCHNDDADLIQASISPTSTPKDKPASSLGKGSPSPRKFAMQYAKSLEFLYSKSGNGGYDWEMANEEAEKFIRECGKESAHVLKNWALTYLNFHGRVKVQPGIFERLWADMQLTERMGDG